MSERGAERPGIPVIRGIDKNARSSLASERKIERELRLIERDCFDSTTYKTPKRCGNTTINIHARID